jgi:hypothetical protein
MERMLENLNLMKVGVLGQLLLALTKKGVTCEEA